MAGTLIEQVPRYSLSYTDDGRQERLQLVVQLPGLASAKDFQVTVKPGLFTLHAEGRYRLSLPLNPPVDEKPELLRFVKKKAVLKAELKVLAAPDSLLRASFPPAAGPNRPQFAHASNQLSPDINIRSHKGFDTMHHSVTEAHTADLSAHAHARQSQLPWDEPMSDSSPDEAAVSRAEALREMMEQLIAQQWTSGPSTNAVPDHARDSRSASSSHGLSDTEYTQDSASEEDHVTDAQSVGTSQHQHAEPLGNHVNGIRSTGSTPGPFAIPKQDSPVTPSLSNPGNVYSSTSSIHAASGLATQTLNPLWSPDSAATSISHPTTPQANANESSDWEMDTAEHTLSPGSGWGDLSSPQSAAHAASPASDTHSAAHSASTSNDVQSAARASNGAQSFPQPATTSCNMAESAQQGSEAASADIYQAAQTRHNKDAAEAFFVKGEEAVKQRDWPKAGRLLTKSCSLNQEITERLADMLSRLDKRFVPRLKKHISSDLLKANPGRAKPAATPESHSQTQEDINADATAAAAADSTQASTSDAPCGADATAAADSPQPATADPPQPATADATSGADATRAAATATADSPQASTSDATSSAAGRGREPSTGCGDGGSLQYEIQQQHAPNRGAADSRKRRFSDISGGDFRKGYRGSQHSRAPDHSAQPETSTRHAQTHVPDGSADSQCNKGPAANGQARPKSQSQSQHGSTRSRSQMWTDEDLGLNVPDEAPTAEMDHHSSILELWVRLSIFIMSCYSTGAIWFSNAVVRCRTGVAYSCNTLLSCCKTAAARVKIGAVYLWGRALGGIRVARGPIWQLFGSSLQPCVPILLPAIRAVVTSVVIALTLGYVACSWLSNYVLLLLWITGRRKWIRSLVMGQKRGERKARLVMWVVSPLLALTTVWWLIANPLDLELLSVIQTCVKWPFQMCRQLICKAWDCVTSGWFVVPACLLSWTLASSPRIKTHCIDGILFWALGRKWTGVAAVLLRMCASNNQSRPRDTWTAQAAIWAGHQAWTNSAVSNFCVFRIVAMVGVWQAWIFREEILAYLSTLMAHDDDVPASKPQAASPGEEKSVPQSPNFNTPREEVLRILSAKSHYAVLEVDSKATEEAIKKARRMKSLLVHPDKVGPDVLGANDAFGKVTLAAEVLSNPVQRREYDAELRASTPYSAQPGQASSQQHDAGEDEANVQYQACSGCDEVHKVTRRPDMDPSNCRWCKFHHTHHPVKRGDGWVTCKYTGPFGMFPKYVVYACLDPDGDVYEVTEGAKCQGILHSEAFMSFGSDSCKVWLTFGNANTTHRDRQKQQQQDRRQERYARQQQRQQSTNEDAGGRKKGRKGRKRR